MNLSLSVIIPAFNAERFIEKAILSVMAQPEVNEILVINDGSTDKTEEIVKDLVKVHDKISILSHVNCINKGRSASRNEGIKKAKGNLIAFLDADDFYLDGRFTKDIEFFKNYLDCDGVYNAVGFHYYSNSFSNDETQNELYTVRKKVEPSQLFEGLLNGKFGHFQIDGLTIRRALFDKTGLFNENLKVAEDTDIFWKMALKGKLMTGVINLPVAMRGVHDSNIFYRNDIYAQNRYEVYNSIISWCFMNDISLKIIDTIFRRVWIIKHSEENSISEEIKFWIKQCKRHPEMLFSYLSLKYFPLIRRRKSIFSVFYR